MRIADITWMHVEEYLKHDDRCVLPLGSTEQHAYLSLAVDAVLSERAAADAAEPLGVPVFPVVAYGLTPYFMAYPGTVTLTLETYQRVLAEVLGSLEHHGFRRIVIVNGHGGNSSARPGVEAWADARPDVTLRWHNWWSAPDTIAVVHAMDPDASHASWMEGFAWTRVDGVQMPTDHKDPIDVSGREELSAEQFRERLGDGAFGGDYRRSEEDSARVWSVAVQETRRQIEEGW